MSNFQTYDSILRQLPKDGRWSYPESYNEVDLYYLTSCGYINIKETVGGGIVLLAITPAGLKFISEGGFAHEYRQRMNKEADDALQRENWIATTKAARSARTIAIWSVLIAAASLIVAAIALIKGSSAQKLIWNCRSGHA